MDKGLYEITEKAVTAQQFLLKYINNTDNFREIVDAAIKDEAPENQPMVLTSLISYMIAKEENIDIENLINEAEGDE